MWQFPNGKSLTLASSPGDRKAAGFNAMRDLRRVLGEIPEHREGARRERKLSRRQSKAPILAVGQAPVRKGLPEKLSEGLLAIPRRSLVAPKYECCTPLRLEEFERTAVTVILGMAMKLITGRTVKVG